jgi:hypothetical protein
MGKRQIIWQLCRMESTREQSPLVSSRAMRSLIMIIYTVVFWGIVLGLAIVL